MSYQEYHPQMPNTLFEAQRIYENGKRDERQEIIDSFIKADEAKKQTRLKTAIHELYKRNVNDELKASPHGERSLSNSEGGGSIRAFLVEAAAFFFFILGLCSAFLMLGVML